MAIEVKLPELGDGIESGDVLEVLVKEGDQIEKDQGVLELETEKATVEVPSSHAGRVSKVHVSDGDTVSVGSVLVTLESADETTEEKPSQKAPAEEEDEAPQEPEEDEEKAKKAEEPEEAEESDEAEAQADEDEQAEEQEAKEVKASEEQQRQKRGAEKAKAERRQGDEAAQGSKVASQTKPSPQDSKEAPAADKKTDDSQDGDLIPAGPAVRRFAREVGVDLGQVQGSGEGGRITRDDVLAVVRQASAKSGKAKKGGETAQDDWGPIRVERLTKIRKTIAVKMHESWSTVPRVTNFDDADVTDLEGLRQSSKADYADRGIKLTSMPFVIKAAAMALRAHPMLNAKVDLDEGQIIYKDYVNIGIAVDSERGLVVPSLRGADGMSIPEIARQLASLAERVRNGSFSMQDLQGSTFTISNLGAIGGTYSTPIVNVPEVAILLVGRTRKLPVCIDDQIVPRLMMPLSLSYDHRLVDGAMAARFLNDVIGYLRAPSRLLLAP